MSTSRFWVSVAALLLSLIAAGCSKNSSPEASGEPTTLKAYGLSASAADSAATLSWPSIPGATAYNVYLFTAVTAAGESAPPK